MKKLLGAITALAIAGGSAEAQNIVLNPGFENGSILSPWVASGWFATTSSGPGNTPPHSGTWAATTGCVGPGCVSQPNPASLFQDLVTVAGQSYDLSYWFHDAGIPSELMVFWNGLQVQDLLNVNNCCVYQQYGVSGLVASGSITRLEYWGRQDPSYNRLDDVSVVASSVTATPEPASLTLLATGLVGVFGAARRRRKAASAA